MPELPEAEANRRRIEAGVLNRTVEGVTLGDDTTHAELPSEAESERLTGRQFTEARRHGKLVFAGSKSGPWIAVHLGMTGSLRVWEEGDEPPSHIRIVFAFEGGRRLGFRCPRKLGWVKVVDDPDGFVAAEGYGPDALSVSREVFADRVGTSRGAVKSALMDQKKIAGIGNLWSDEILFHTGTAPEARPAEMPDDRTGALHDAMGRLLRAALEVDADYSALPADWLLHNRQAGRACPRCNGHIASRKVGGRTAYFCDTHQAEAA